MPTVVVAVDARAPIEAAAGAAARLLPDGLVTLGRTQPLTASAEQLPEARRRAGRAVDSLPCREESRRSRRRVGRARAACPYGSRRRYGLGRRRGTIAGELRRTRLFARSPDVPVMVIPWIAPACLRQAAPSLCALPQVELLRQSRPSSASGAVVSRPGEHRRASSRRDGASSPCIRPERIATAGSRCTSGCVYRLRKSHAAGVTLCAGSRVALGTPMRPDRGWRVRRKAPIVTTIVDRDDRIAEWFGYIDAITGADGARDVRRSGALGHDQV